jgi:hypothetical protein
MAVEWYKRSRIGHVHRYQDDGVTKTKYGLFFCVELAKKLTTDYVQVGWDGIHVIIKPADKSTDYTCKKVSYYSRAKGLKTNNGSNCKKLSAFGRWLDERLSDGHHAIVFNEDQGWYEIQPETID